MDVESVIAWGVVVLSLALSGFVAASEVALASLSRAELRERRQQGIARAELVMALLATPGRFLTTLLQIKMFAVVAAATAVTFWALTRHLSFIDLIALLILLVAAFVLMQTVVRALVIRNSDSAALHLARPVSFLTMLFSPFTWGYLRVVSALHRQSGGERLAEESIFMSEDGLRYLLNVSEEESRIEESEKEMIASIFELDKTTVREVMVPRIDITALDEDLPLNEALDFVIEAGHSRIPVYRETIDNIVGVLYAKDLLRYFQEAHRDTAEVAHRHAEINLSMLLREPYFVPESKLVDDLLRELQKRKVHIAFVVDEYGGTAGVVTIEDLLEEIVGEIQDEYDEEEPLFKAEDGNQFIFNARISLSEVNDLLGVALPSDGGDTLAGFIYNQLGHVPSQDEEVPFGNILMRVLAVDGNRIESVYAMKISAPEMMNGEKNANRRENGTPA